MILHELLNIEDKIKTVSIVGAGGKTSTMYALAREANQAGKKTLIFTSTHIAAPGFDDMCFSEETECLSDIWQTRKIAVIGTKGGDRGGLTIPNQSMVDQAIKMADAVFIEADGAKCLPMKYPASYEPVILKESQKIILLVGLSALNQPIDLVCHRAVLAKEQLNLSEQILSEQIMAELIHAGYARYSPTVFLNQADTQKDREAGMRIKIRLKELGMKDVVIGSLKEMGYHRI